MRQSIITALILIAVNSPLAAQESIPSFLCGTWKIENSDTYEHWDLLNHQSLKGFLYKIEEGHPIALEYLDIFKQEDQIFYVATVLDQNNGKGIAFTLTQTDSLTFTFKNPDHDFPKVITYHKQSPSKVLVSIGDGKQKTISYFMIRQK